MAVAPQAPQASGVYSQGGGIGPYRRHDAGAGAGVAAQVPLAAVEEASADVEVVGLGEHPGITAAQGAVFQMQQIRAQQRIGRIPAVRHLQLQGQGDPR